jgi:hypothetical protein
VIPSVPHLRSLDEQLPGTTEAAFGSPGELVEPVAQSKAVIDQPHQSTLEAHRSTAKSRR